MWLRVSVWKSAHRSFSVTRHADSRSARSSRATRFVGHGPDGYRMALEYLKEHDT